jgi:hypothetical protein
MNIWDTGNVRNFLTSYGTTSFSRRIMIHIFCLLVSAHFLKISGQCSSDSFLVISKMLWMIPQWYNIKDKKWKEKYEGYTWKDIQGTVLELI